MGIEGAGIKAGVKLVAGEAAEAAAAAGNRVLVKGLGEEGLRKAGSVIGKDGIEGAGPFVVKEAPKPTPNAGPKLPPPSAAGGAAGITVAGAGRAAPAAADSMNLITKTNPSEIIEPMRAIMGNRRAIGLSGYSAPPAAAKDTYADVMASYLKGRTGGHTDRFGVLASPTADAGSVDAAATIVAQEQKMPIGYTTSQGYTKYIKPENFPSNVNVAEYAKAPKFVFPNDAAYSAAQATAAGEQVIAGGRTQALADFVNTVNQGKPVTLLDSPTFGGVWDAAKGRPDNVSRFVQEQLTALRNGTTPEGGFHWMPEVGFTEDFAKNILDRQSAGETPYLYMNVISPADALNAGRTAARTFGS